MLPRPLLTTTFGLSYRKIPILAIGKDVYCDTSLIIEALEHFFPPSDGWGTIYPPSSIPGWNYRGYARGFASFWTDRPFFRTTTGLIPPSVWASPFGTDRAQLIGHTLDPAKLAAKVPQNLGAFETHLSLLEPTLKDSSKWLMPTEAPSLADISVYYQLKWGMDIARGKGVYNLTGGNVGEDGEDIAQVVFNEERYPGVWAWFNRFEAYISSLPDLQTEITSADTRWKEDIRRMEGEASLGLVPTPAGPNKELDGRRGLVEGVLVSVVPDDTGKGNPTVGTLMHVGVEEISIKPEEKGEVHVVVHFPRVGFVIKGMEGSRL
ncbi:uncharacterized protein CC84DRAFT_1092043 [Paraphaeosphaeria sporulosa]|uniref:DUF7962 domain-containing protein n=1 Tax=Paraphaeosphaeria sporulosa TaxID=1460663 RepID=A0A177CF39_9PLEO|nr:uncharacterized protein CC84DRAFT_1092043 [Paraphaeosphaeria sporulosa]OAG06223.1 hypothetical protein CC84DRAFT_1092043 [Paraphaeosphaeria sporulosa]